jgi:hypothetical protein
MSDPLRYLEQRAGNAVREALEGLRAEIDRLRAVVATSRRDGWIAGRAAALEHLRIRSNNIRTDNSIKGVLSERARNVDLVDAIAHSIAALTPPENAVSDISAERRAELRQRIARAMPHALTDAELRAPLDATEPVTAGEVAGVRGRLQRLAASDVSQTHAAFSDLNGPEFYGITARTAAALIERLARELDNAAEARIAMEDAASQLRRDYPQVPADSAWQPEMPPPVAQAQTKARPSEQGGGAATASRPSLAAQAGVQREGK